MLYLGCLFHIYSEQGRVSPSAWFMSVRCDWSAVSERTEGAELRKEDGFSFSWFISHTNDGLDRSSMLMWPKLWLWFSSSGVWKLVFAEAEILSPYFSAIQYLWSKRVNSFKAMQTDSLKQKIQMNWFVKLFKHLKSFSILNSEMIIYIKINKITQK